MRRASATRPGRPSVVLCTSPGHRANVERNAGAVAPEGEPASTAQPNRVLAETACPGLNCTTNTRHERGVSHSDHVSSAGDPSPKGQSGVEELRIDKAGG